jgi:nickel-dependent lactate racemase
VQICNIAGYDKPALNDDQIKSSVGKLIGSTSIREIATGKKDVVIIIDDMTRVTRAAKIVPFVLAELAAAGIPDKNIRFVVALGGHAPLDRSDLIKKLGEKIVVNYPVYNHNIFQFCTYAGTTSRGNKVLINSEVMACDFKITIGSVVPHGLASYSGGGKKILPGVAAAETIAFNHELRHTTDYETNAVRLDMEEAAEIVGIDVAIECMLNYWGETTAIFAGTEQAAHAASVQEARTHYLAPKAVNKDIVIANAYAKANEATSVMRCLPSVNTAGGDMVIIANAPRGQIVHYLMGWWGRNTGGLLKPKSKAPAHVNRLIIFSEYPSKADLDWFEDSPRVMLLSKWDDIMKILKEAHGDNASVAVYPNADILHFG